jgi:thymidylate kinase
MIFVVLKSCIQELRFVIQIFLQVTFKLVINRSHDSNNNHLEFENYFSQHARNTVQDQYVTVIANCLARSLTVDPGP